MDKHYYEWRKIGVERAARALANSGMLFDLPTSFGNGAAVYRTGLETRRGACYLTSNFVKCGLGDTSAN
ncbi:hypothetical protein [Pseudoduganella violacea]|uniref:Uncharacterized protein n=1 Tax=Pseudoduganella violacea TaxID=1715466 RepID=A0A7W5FX17_9BURK|nr:hypothetical protein [Pseudoduganella violacea]MBB3122494.1 hypothetical protein [Pseudoduganella violacea]